MGLRVLFHVGAVLFCLIIAYVNSAFVTCRYFPTFYLRFARRTIPRNGAGVEILEISLLSKSDTFHYFYTFGPPRRPNLSLSMDARAFLVQNTLPPRGLKRGFSPV